MAGPLKSGDGGARDWLAFNRLRDVQHQILARDAIVSMMHAGFDRKMDVVAGTMMFKIVSVQDDYITGNTWDGTTAGTDAVFVAKQFKHRKSLTTETILGVHHTYSYSPDPGGDPNNPIRHDNDGTSTEDQRIVPPWCVGDIIYALAGTTGVNDGSGNPIGLIECSDTRAWAAPDPADSGTIDGGAP